MHPPTKVLPSRSRGKAGCCKPNGSALIIRLEAVDKEPEGIWLVVPLGSPRSRLAIKPYEEPQQRWKQAWELENWVRMPRHGKGMVGRAEKRTQPGTATGARLP